MRLIRPKLFVILLMLSTVISLFCVYGFSYFKIVSYSKHFNRIYDLRKVPQEFRASLLVNFLTPKLHSPIHVLILGDSQSNGMGYANNEVASYYLSQKSGKTVVNCAFQDSRIKDNMYVLDQFIKNSTRVDWIFFNLSPSQVQDFDFQRIDVANTSDFRKGIFSLPYTFLKFSLSLTQSTTRSDNLILDKLNNYIELTPSCKIGYDMLLIDFINKARKVSNHVVVYISPYSPRALAFNHVDTGDLNAFKQDVKKLCEIQSVNCVDMQTYFTDDDFSDIVHFNSNGHKKMADILFEIISPENFSK